MNRVEVKEKEKKYISTLNIPSFVWQMYLWLGVAVQGGPGVSLIAGIGVLAELVSTTSVQEVSILQSGLEPLKGKLFQNFYYEKVYRCVYTNIFTSSS